jgi:exodeoxyribonuclease V alpha subunit
MNMSKRFIANVSIGDPIRYDSEYYIIKNIKYNEIKMPTEIEVGYISKKEKKTEWISPNDVKIKIIDKKLHEKIISYLKFLDRYNNTIFYLLKKKGLYEALNTNNVEEDIQLYFGRCKLKINDLNKIERALKKTQCTALQLKNITKYPFDFITEEYQLISFTRADSICEEFKLTIDFKIKCMAWSYDLFIKVNNAFYIPRWKYMSDFNKFCKNKAVDATQYLPFIEKNIIDKTIDGNVYKTTQYLLNREKEITDLTMDLFYDQEYDITRDKINFEIDEYEREREKIEKKNKPDKESLFKLEPEQRKSVICSILNKLSIITGPPGTGKTEIIKCINYCLYNLYNKENNIIGNTITTDASDSASASDDDHVDDDNTFIKASSISLIAPTGLAFINMKNSQQLKHYNKKISGTCHKILYDTFENIKKHVYECNCVNNDCKYRYKLKLIIVDEVSMVDIFIYYEILKMCEYFDARLILIGDVNQLASIGPGTVLKNLISSNCFDVEVLKKIKRQNGGGLVNVIKKMNKNIEINENCFKDHTIELRRINDFVNEETINAESLLKLIDDNILTKGKTKFITYFKDPKYIFNTHALNNILQEKYNPNSDEIHSKNKYDNKYTFRIGDSIVRTENDYSSEKMRANGEEAVIMDYDGKKVTIEYDTDESILEKREEIFVDDLYDNFALNYAITIHKSQGSQYTNVVLFLEPSQTFMSKSALYTAISRAKERCIIIADIADFKKCQKNSDDKKVSLLMRDSDKYEF